MKRVYGALIAVCMCAGSLPLFSMELSAALASSNFTVNLDGQFDPDQFSFGGEFEMRDRLSDSLSGSITWKTDPFTGNLLKARAVYRTPFLEIGAGPSFGVLNSEKGTNTWSLLFQPGMGIGVNVLLPGIWIASIDTDFALPSAVQVSGQHYIGSSSISAGFYLPNLLCSLAVSQRNGVTEDMLGTRVISLTDYGLYTTAFKKGSPFRISIDFIYRYLEYYYWSIDTDSKKIGNLVLGCGIEWLPKSDISFFVEGTGAVYSFSIGDTLDDLETFMIELKTGITIKLSELSVQ